MKKFLTIIFFSLLTLNAFALESKEVEVWVRNSKGKLLKEKKIITGLLSKDLAETENFKVVVGRSSEAAPLDESEVGKKASNVLFHLEFARSYFKNHLKSISLPEKTIVRIEIKDTFLSEFHFAHEKFSTQSNNAETIPPSDRMRYAGVPSWGNEIWFRPPAVIKTKSDLERMGQLMDNPAYKGPVRESYIERSATTLASGAASGTTAYAEYELGYLLGMLSFVEVFPKFLKLTGKTYKKKMLLDTAMIPEIIYHEYGHVALYDYLSFDEKTPVVEGLANYFAAKMINYHKLGFDLKKFGKGYGGYTGKSPKNYDYSNETKSHSHSSFLLSLFWSLDKEFEDFEHILFETRKYLTKDSDIKYDLVHALTEVISEKTNNDRAERLKLLRVFGSHGL